MDQKLENILNLALETPEEEREQTESLNVGYSAESRSWELIVKYHGSLDGLREQNIVVEELIAGYAILTVPETLVDTVSETPEIEYVEKPKRFYYQQTDPDGASCFPPVTRRTPFLNGRGVLLAVLDSGITWDLEVFRKADGSTRIRYLWVCLGMGCCLHALIQAWTMRILISAHRTGQAELQFYGIRRFREHRRYHRRGRCHGSGKRLRIRKCLRKRVAREPMGRLRKGFLSEQNIQRRKSMRRCTAVYWSVTA